MASECEQRKVVKVVSIEKDSSQAKAVMEDVDGWDCRMVCEIRLRDSVRG